MAEISSGVYSWADWCRRLSSLIFSVGGQVTKSPLYFYWGAYVLNLETSFMLGISLLEIATNHQSLFCLQLNILGILMMLSLPVSCRANITKEYTVSV